MFILFSLIILNYTNNHFQEQSQDYLKDLVQSHLELLDNNFSQLQRYAQFIANDQDVQKAVQYRNQTDELDYAIELYNQRNVDEKLRQLKTMPNISNAVIIGANNKGLYSFKEDLKLDYDFSDDQWFRAIKKLETRTGNISHFTSFHETNYLLNKKMEALSMLTPIMSMYPYISSDNSYLMIDIDLSRTLDAVSKKDVQIGMHDGQNWLYLPELKQLTEYQKKKLESSIRTDKGYVLLESKSWKEPDVLLVMNTSNITGWKVIGLKSLHKIRDVKIATFVFISILIIISGTMIAFVSLGISKTILNPISLLIEKFNKIAEGDYAVQFEESSSEEVAKLSQTAEYMIHNMVDLSNKVLHEQERYAAAQMKLLQNQINPHFLNNVLQTIKGFAVSEDIDKISRLTTLLGKSLTYSTYQPFEKVTIETELQHIENYIGIQNIRYEDKIYYAISCEEDLKQIKIPKLMVQPLVENAIEHGFLNKKAGFIDITVEKDSTQINIIVTDNGTGMEAGQVERLNTELQFKNPYSKQSSIGLLNVAQRIKREFGGDYGIKILSSVNGGTSVILELPYEEI